MRTLESGPPPVAAELRDGALAQFLERTETGLLRSIPRDGDPVSNPRGDHDLDAEGFAVAPPPPHRPAAVLVPVRPTTDGLAVMLTQRAAHLRSHSGQIAFPGGKIDEGDLGPAEAALREAHEEIGLSPTAVRVLGYLDPYLSATGFMVTPVVGLVESEARLRINPNEVAELFEVPLDILMDPDGHVVGSRPWKGRTRYYYSITVGERLIWGVTAGIVHNLYERLYR
jgi:8-oxo-dGTP pyrophosphatase MutT (NUDIX family)